jgi:hypothetical protein
MNKRAARIAKSYKVHRSPSQSKGAPFKLSHNVITVPPLGTTKEPNTGTASVTGIRQLAGSVAQPMNGVSLANTQEVVTLDSPGKHGAWGVVSQTMPNTVIVPHFNLEKPVTVEQWVTAVQPGSQHIVITTHHAGDASSDPSEVLRRHEMGGVVADQIVTLAAQKPVHYFSNVLTMEGGAGAVSRYEYRVSEGVVPWRIMLTQCWLRRVTAEESM